MPRLCRPSTSQQHEHGIHIARTDAASNMALRHAVLAGSRHHAIRPAGRPFTTVDDTLLD